MLRDAELTNELYMQLNITARNLMEGSSDATIQEVVSKDKELSQRVCKMYDDITEICERITKSLFRRRDTSCGAPNSGSDREARRQDSETI